MTDNEHYVPKDIFFTRDQIIWLIAWLPVLEDGAWPPDPKETGYTEAPRVMRSRRHTAPFETPCQFAAEVRERLDSCRDAGETLFHEVQHGLDAYELLSRPAQRALNYCSGWRRRRQTFSEWCKQGRQRAKKQVK